MKEKIKTCLAVCILVITVPYVVTLVFQGGETSTGTGTIQEALKEPAKENSGPQKTSDEEENSDPQKTSDEKESPGLKKTDAKQDVEGYLTGILAKQIPLDYQREAVKAQAVIARTALTLALETEGQKLPESMSREEMLELWGQEGFEQNYQQLEEAAQATKGEAIDYNEYLTGKRTEGSIYGSFNLARRIGNTVGSSLAVLMLGWVGYDTAAAVQSAAAITGIKALCVLMPGIFVIGSWLAFTFVWNITPEIREKITQSKGGQSA